MQDCNCHWRAPLHVHSNNVHVHRSVSNVKGSGIIQNCDCLSFCLVSLMGSLGLVLLSFGEYSVDSAEYDGSLVSAVSMFPHLPCRCQISLTRRSSWISSGIQGCWRLSESAGLASLWGDPSTTSVPGEPGPPTIMMHMATEQLDRFNVPCAVYEVAWPTYLSLIHWDGCLFDLSSLYHVSMCCTLCLDHGGWEWYFVGNVALKSAPIPFQVQSPDDGPFPTRRPQREVHWTAQPLRQQQCRVATGEEQGENGKC